MKYIQDIHFESSAISENSPLHHQEIEIYINGWYLSSVSIEDLSFEALIQIRDQYKAIPEYERTRVERRLLLACEHAITERIQVKNEN